jgi:hypothetical protein
MLGIRSSNREHKGVESIVYCFSAARAPRYDWHVSSCNLSPVIDMANARAMHAKT